MTFSLDLSTDVGLCRSNFPDTDEAAPIFSDERWQSFLTLAGPAHESKSHVLRACARARQAAAADLVLTLRVTEVLGLKVDGAAAGRELRLQASKELEDATKLEEAHDAASGGLFDIAEWAVDSFSAREIVAGQLLRSGL